MNRCENYTLACEACDCSECEDFEWDGTGEEPEEVEIYLKAIITHTDESGINVSTEFNNCNLCETSAMLISLLKDYADEYTLDKTVELFQSFLHYFNDTKEVEN